MRGPIFGRNFELIPGGTPLSLNDLLKAIRHRTDHILDMICLADSICHTLDPYYPFGRGHT